MNEKKKVCNDRSITYIQQFKLLELKINNSEERFVNIFFKFLRKFNVTAYI